MGNIFGHQKKNPLQPNTHPSGTQPTLPWRNALAVCSTWRRGWVRGGGGATNRARRRRQCHKNLQKLKRKLFPNREPKLVPKIGTTTRTLVHCYLKANYAREGYQNMYPKWEPFLVPKTGTRTRTLVHCYLKTKYAREGYQNMSPKWEPFLVPKTGTHYNPMRSRVRPKLEPFLVPRRRIHYSHMHSRVRRKRPKHTFQIL